MSGNEKNKALPTGEKVPAPAKPAAKRIRRTAEEARRLILDAAEQRLAKQGPEGLRLQDIARDIGISHPAILHHFESREGLVRALVTRTNNQLRDSLLAAFSRTDMSTTDATDQISHVFEVLSDRGTARLLSWMLLTGRTMGNTDAANIMGDIVDALHVRRADYAEAAGKPVPDKEDSLFIAMLTANAAFGEAIIGRQLAESGGLDEEGIKRFRKWFAALLNQHETDER